MATTNIEWADMTINPVVGCSKCSPGCDNCYAERFAARLAKNPKTAAKYAGVVDERGKWTGKISALDLSCFDKLPKKPKRIFVGSMTDLFNEWASPVTVEKIIKEIRNHSQHTFMLLTKRPQFIRCVSLNKKPLPNVWLGVTVCNQQEADEKIPVLLSIPAAKRFVSIEPMLGPVDLDRFVFNWKKRYLHGSAQLCPDLVEKHAPPSLDWVIVGGETGPNARPMHPDWVRSLRDQCQAAGVPFFFKGWGGWLSWSFFPESGIEDDMEQTKFSTMEWRSGHWEDVGWPCWADSVDGAIDDEHCVGRVGKKAAGRLLDGREWNEFPKGS